MSKTKDQKVLLLSNTLRDLALLRASDVDLAGLVPTSSADGKQQSDQEKATEASLENSYKYARSARTVIKINDKGDVDVQGERIDDIREKLSNIDEGVAES